MAASTDVGMVQLGRNPGFAKKPRTGCEIVEAFGRQNLNGHVSVKLLVMSPVHYAHAARSKLLDNAEVGECCADQVSGARGSTSDSFTPGVVSGAG